MGKGKAEGKGGKVRAKAQRESTHRGEEATGRGIKETNEDGKRAGQVERGRLEGHAILN